MIEITCQCGRMLKAPDSAIGKKGRCKGCGSEVEILPPVVDEPETVDDEPMPDLAINVDEEDAPLDPKVGPPVPKPNPAMPPEPWFYGFLDGYAKLCVGLAVVQFLLVLCGAVIGILTTMSENQRIPLVAGTVVLVSLAWMLGIILVSCPILLAVDAARNLRAMRFGGLLR